MSFKALKSSSCWISRAFKPALQPLPMTRKEADVGTMSTHNPSSPRTWLTPEVPLLPYTGWLFLSKNISKLLYWLQLLSATACVTLSLMRLIQQDYGEVSKGDFDKRNRKSALNIFYGLAIAEALLFLLERTYWEYKVSHCKLLEEVNRECGLGNSGLVTIKRFFYDAYSMCVNGSIFDGLKMDLVSFGAELMDSSFCDEQLSGARVIRRFVTDSRFKDDTLRKIGSSMPTMERVVEMLNWKKPEEDEIRMAAGEILSNLAGKKQNSLRVACIPGAMEAISSLLYAPDHDNYSEANYEYSDFNLIGLLILKRLARDVGNCEKIGSTRGLLPKIIRFTQSGQLLKKKHVAKSQISAVKRSLKLVKMLVGTTGSTGKNLRREVSEIVFTISNIREMIQYGESYPGLQKLGMEILTRLALDEEAKEKVGRTGGLLGKLLSIFVGDGLVECHEEEGVRNAAGEALAMLAMESLTNCSRVLRMNALEKLVGCLEHPSLRVNGARVLRNLCAYSGDHHLYLLKGLTSATNTVIRLIMLEEDKLQEVGIGLLAQIIRINGSSGMLNREVELELAAKLVQTLRQYKYPSTRVPRIRRFVIELAMVMMKEKKANIGMFRELGLEEELLRVGETTSEIECFNVFSGRVGLCPYSETVQLLVDMTMGLLHRD